MSNTKASDDNVESPSIYGDKAYKKYRKKEKQKDDTSSQNQLNNTIEGRELEEGQTFQY
jgi:hypothetical protein